MYIEPKTYMLHLTNDELDFLASLVLAASNLDVQYNSPEDAEHAQKMEPKFEHMYNVLKS